MKIKRVHMSISPKSENFTVSSVPLIVTSIAYSARALLFHRRPITVNVTGQPRLFTIVTISFLHVISTLYTLPIIGVYIFEHNITKTPCESEWLYRRKQFKLW